MARWPVTAITADPLARGGFHAIEDEAELERLKIMPARPTSSRMRQWLNGEPQTQSVVLAAAPREGDHSRESTVAAAIAALGRYLAVRPANRGSGVIVCGPDRYALTNHVLGYDVGAEVMATVVGRVASIIRSDEFVFRLTAGEFVIVVPDLPAARDLEILATRIVTALQAPVVLADGRSHRVMISAGLASAFDRAASAERLLADAGLARSRAESSGGGRVVVASIEDRVVASAHFELVQDLLGAFDDHQFVLHYQPVVEASTGRIRAMEALVRWRHPVRQLLHPGSFLAELAALGLGSALDRFVLGAACQVALGHAESGTGASISVNVSAEQLLGSELSGLIVEALSVAGLPASRLSIEIPEPAFGAEHDRLLPALLRLKTLGVGLTIDNGTGAPAPLALVASTGCRDVSYKLDRSLLRDPSPGRLAAAAAMVAGVAGHEVSVVAQGVQDDADRDRVTAAGIELVQGFGVQRPAAIEQLAEQWRSGRLSTYPASASAPL